MVLIGESESTTTIKLELNRPGFGDPSNPLGMIHPTADAAQGYPPEPGDANDACQNTIQDLTTGIGTGNPQMFWVSPSALPTHRGCNRSLRLTLCFVELAILFLIRQETLVTDTR
jgi:hypothetical protein